MTGDQSPEVARHYEMNIFHCFLATEIWVFCMCVYGVKSYKIIESHLSSSDEKDDSHSSKSSF